MQGADQAIERLIRLAALLANIGSSVVLAKGFEQCGEGFGVGADAVAAQFEHPVGAEVGGAAALELLHGALGQLNFHRDQTAGMGNNVAGGD